MIPREYEYYSVVLAWIRQLMAEKETAVISIDGRCGSGKTTLADFLQSVLPCNVIHADDYCLPFSRRVKNWERIPGGNMDFDRLLQEAIAPAKGGKTIKCRPYSCHTGKYLPEIILAPRPLTVIEGSYSQHPLLAEEYDMKIFVTFGWKPGRPWGRGGAVCFSFRNCRPSARNTARLWLRSF